MHQRHRPTQHAITRAREREIERERERERANKQRESVCYRSDRGGAGEKAPEADTTASCCLRENEDRGTLRIRELLRDLKSIWSSWLLYCTQPHRKIAWAEPWQLIPVFPVVQPARAETLPYGRHERSSFAPFRENHVAAQAKGVYDDQESMPRRMRANKNGNGTQNLSLGSLGALAIRAGRFLVLNPRVVHKWCIGHGAAARNKRASKQAGALQMRRERIGGVRTHWPLGREP